jgi:hypothetical protein
MPGPYYANTTQIRKRYLSVIPLGNRLVIAHRGECWQVKWSPLRGKEELKHFSSLKSWSVPDMEYLLQEAECRSRSIQTDCCRSRNCSDAPPAMHFNVLGSKRTMWWKLVSSQP